MTGAPFLVLCLCLAVSSVYPAAVPTQDTMVVARSDDQDATTVPSTATDLTTNEPNAPIKLTEMRVHSEVALRYARTAVVTHVRNPAKIPQEATFRVLLPDTAFISGFVMTLDGKSYKAYVKEKEEAKQIYNEAVSQGLGAAHVAAKARDSNHFTVSVNVEANTTAVFNLTYEELLVRRNGVYNHAINLHPGSLVPNMKVTVHIKESQKITDLRVPEIRTGNEIDATAEDAQNNLAAIERNGDKEATITFTPDLEEQRRLVEVYAEKTKESASRPVYWRGDEDDSNEKKQEGVLGQFVVQYDVDRSKSSEILVNDGYFVHFLAPSSLPPLPKHVVFVLDTSGSMMGRKVEQLREAMQVILAKLNKGDYFNIVEFDSFVQIHDLDETKELTKRPHYSYYELPNEPPKMVAPALATADNINKAKNIVSQLQASGGTNINSALDVAIELIQRGINPSPPPKKELAASETENTTEVKREEKALAEVNKTTEGTQLEPIIIFLTDGDPTVGETSPSRIISHVSEKNSGPKKASIFSLAFGEDADRNFLRKLSLRNDGFMRHIYEAADAALQLRDFYRQVSSPLLSDVKFIYPKQQVKEGSTTRSKFRTVYDGSEIIVAGQITDETSELAPQVSAFCGVGDGVGRKQYEITPKVPVSREKSDYLPLERLWAYLTIKQLLDEKDASDTEQKGENSPEKKALAIALKYEFVTPLTSLVVVKPNATNAVNAESVDGQSEQPMYQHISGGAIPLSLGGLPLLSPLSSSSGVAQVAYFHPAPQPVSDFIPSFPSGGQESLALDSAPLFEKEETAFDYVTGHVASRPVYYRTESYRIGATSSYGSSFALSNRAFLRTGNKYGNIFRHIPTTPIVYATTTRPPSPLAIYHLEEYSWASPLLNSGLEALVLPVNGTDVNLKLSKDKNAPKAAGGDEECLKSTEGTAGVCVYITRCDAAKSLTVEIYRDIHCSVSDGYAGVCCPRSKVDEQAN